MNGDRDLLVRYLENRLSADELAALNRRLEQESSLRAELDRQRQLRETLGLGRSDSFAPFFADRVMKRLLPAQPMARADVFYQSLQSVFAKTALAGLVIACALAAYNFISYGDLGVASTIPETLFGLPSASLMDALSYNAY